MRIGLSEFFTSLAFSCAERQSKYDYFFGNEKSNKNSRILARSLPDVFSDNSPRTLLFYNVFYLITFKSPGREGTQFKTYKGPYFT
jgi:hypothetical protein